MKISKALKVLMIIFIIIVAMFNVYFYRITASAGNKFLNTGSSGSSGELYYKEKTDGSLKITGCKNTSKKIEVPYKIDGIEVTEIADNAFKNKKNINSVKISNGVAEIGEESFYNLEKIDKIVLPVSIRKIDSKAFKNCKNLQIIYISNEIEYIADDAFENCDNLKIITTYSKYIKKYCKKNNIDLEYLQQNKFNAIENENEKTIMNIRTLSENGLEELRILILFGAILVGGVAVFISTFAIYMTGKLIKTAEEREDKAENDELSPDIIYENTIKSYLDRTSKKK